MLKLLGPKQGCTGAPLLPNSPLYSQQIINAQFQTGSLRCVGSGWQRDLPAVILRTWVEIMRRSELLVLGEMWMKSCQHRQTCHTSRLHQLSPVPFMLYLKFKSDLGEGRHLLPKFKTSFALVYDKVKLCSNRSNAAAQNVAISVQESGGSLLLPFLLSHSMPEGKEFLKRQMHVVIKLAML